MNTATQKPYKYKDTEIGGIPENWNFEPFGEVAYLSKEVFDPKKTGQDESTVYLGLEHFCRGGFTLNGVGQSDEIQSSKFRFVSGDVLFGKLRPYFKKVYSPKFDGVCSTDIWVLRAKQGVDQKFLYFLVGSDTFLNKAVESSEGTKMPRASWDFIANYKFPIPFLSEQQQIANFLSSLDDKIELNRRMNKTLEEIGKALFKRWFVNFEFPNDDGKPYKSSGGEMVGSELGEIPEGWNLKIIGDFVSIDRGVSYKGKYLSNKGVPMLNLGSFNLDGSLKLDTLKYYTGDYNSSNTVSAGDIVVANTDMTQNRVILGSACIVPDSFEGKRVLFTHHVYGLRIRENIPSSYLYRVLKDDNFKNHAIGYATGTTILFLPKEAVLNYKVVLPSEKILNEFNNVYTNLIHEQELNSHEIENLSRIRDSLLPRLMSGKLRILN